jgi:hypothetical protein
VGGPSQASPAPGPAAAEAVRSLNHATSGRDGLEQPSDACEVLVMQLREA